MPVITRSYGLTIYIYFESSKRCSTTGVTTAVVLSFLWDDAYKITLGKNSLCGGSSFHIYTLYTIEYGIYTL